MTPYLKNIALSVGGIAVAVGVYLAGGATASNYSGPILDHLVDVIQGATTKTEVAPNAPLWSFGEPLSQPLNISIATSSHPSAASGLASSTPYTFRIATLDGNGTTTLGDAQSITTDASTTQNKPEDIILKWTPVTGATGYAIYFATSSAPTAYSQYFLATTSGQYDFSTSSGALAGSNTLTVGTAFGIHLSQNGRSWINDKATATSSATASTTVLQVGGQAVFVSNATTSACESDTAGAVFFNTANSHEWGCNGQTWTKIF